MFTHELKVKKPHFSSSVFLFTAIFLGFLIIKNKHYVIPPQKTHQFPHIKRHHIRFRNCPPHADTHHALPGQQEATQPHSDRVFSGFDSAFGSSDKISTAFDMNSPHLDRVLFSSDRVPTIFDTGFPPFQ